ncbi:MAG TPA: acetyl-CoA carboxylase biotin carboxyl carrier protein [Alphaproteobacteria bacterium]|jgi:acetyl-CoA carboxylase biotin carboxyl carrier protein
MAKPNVEEELVRKLAQLLEETGLTEIEVADGTWKVRVSKASSAVGMVPAAVAAATTAAVNAAAHPAAGEDPARHPGAVTSPMVGTVYVAPEPNAASYVKVGDHVAEGQTVMLIEAMKTMNPIRAPRAGKISQILVANAAPVEYGEVLLIIE